MRKFSRTNKKKKGFTLIELLIVISIIGILATLIVPKFSNVTKDAKIKTDLANARTIYNVVNTCIANDEIKDTDFKEGVLSINDSRIKKYIQVIPKPKAKEGDFVISKTDENIVIMIDKEVIYPTDDVGASE
ncbi:type II secretion system protein [Clostridium algidicarnis]|uniref:type II secretion system protein n=1 Tax=Clostridium algidicarnis TaxID=37659 RepID=UPI001C0D80F8|nr:prepilin-type N-terminal cleavage/methylation domain-containing protein [Clostridium algidicarnis]MBU3204539.1 prepilin-type N-terminal cleavage/methylation domain-containing protein [Clostridium algidicarnis]MBU3206334.1 prepilin-type N-terminal cleavage/methylation domain-containing protein [Clostridium algidicarnis]MBU3212377.1 prepilin-type N-terminal cleavage/methylation domain-containing protein [Clostridium algidicarnis]MBU3222809.1 prepilin-type N-terminal cleavage/methylation domain